MTGIATFFTDLLARHGYWAVAATVGLESMGVPLPGETVLVTAAVYSGATGQLQIALVIAWAIAGAIAGDNAGFIIGRFAHPWLRRHGHVVHLNHDRFRLGEYLFRHHGGKVVFLGRFVAVLRALAALLAGLNGMVWSRFLLFNATGAAAWATLYGGAGYWFGAAIEKVTKPLAFVMGAAAVIGGLAFILYVRRHERLLLARVEADDHRSALQLEQDVRVQNQRP